MVLRFISPLMSSCRTGRRQRSRRRIRHQRRGRIRTELHLHQRLPDNSGLNLSIRRRHLPEPSTPWAGSGESNRINHGEDEDSIPDPEKE